MRPLNLNWTGAACRLPLFRRGTSIANAAVITPRSRLCPLGIVNQLPRVERLPMRHLGLRSFLVLLLVVCCVRPSFGVVQFYIQYKKDFLDEHKDKEYVETVNKSANRCFVCHQGKNRKNRNAFGEHLAELLDWKKDQKDKEKISEMLKKAVALHTDSKDDKSETYMDRIKASKWPAGELKDLQKEPEKKDGEKEGAEN